MFYSLDTYDPEGYNPESPGLTAAARNSYRQFIPRVQTQRSNLIGLTSGEGQGPRGNSCLLLFCFCFFNPLLLIPKLSLILCLCFVHVLAANIVIQTEPAAASSCPGNNEPCFNMEQDNRKRTLGPSTAEGPATKKPWMDK